MTGLQGLCVGGGLLPEFFQNFGKNAQIFLRCLRRRKRGEMTKSFRPFTPLEAGAEMRYCEVLRRNTNVVIGIAKSAFFENSQYQ